MYRFQVATELEECEALWRANMPREYLSDLWEVRQCFHREFQRPPWFLVAEDDQAARGLLPLSWIEESRFFGYFPGETWEGKTWLEQNRFPDNGNGLAEAILEQLPAPLQARYLLPDANLNNVAFSVDEVGYLFHPADYDYDFENYLHEFSGKSAKRLRRELENFEQRRLSYRYGRLSDFEYLVQMNLDRFGVSSYFFDRRFRDSLRRLMYFLDLQDWLRLVTVIIDGEVAAVDLGAVYRGVYTLLAGGTNARFPGVAKLINVHHLHFACQQRLRQVDFLCGNFSWKELFHLKPRPLYLLSRETSANALVSQAVAERVA